MSDILINNNFYISTSNACVTDLTPPTFAGITSLDVETRGQIRAMWSAATDATTPLRYEIYIQASTATGLFNLANVIGITSNLQYDTFTMPDGSFLVNGTTYYVGVRALDGVSNRDANTVSMSVISTGVTVFADAYNVEGAFAINSSNQLQGTLWCLKNSQLATSSNAVMGTASYQVYDKNGNAVVGMSGSGIAVDSNGQYKITPVSSTLNLTLDHYMVKVTINVDGANRQDYVSLIQKVPEYEINGSFSINTSNQLESTFWATADDEVISNLARLGTASYQVYDKAGNAVVGMSGSGISANAQGLFISTPIASLLTNELSHYSVKVTMTVDNITRNNFLPIIGSIPNYEVEGAFAINSSNQFQGTLWAKKGSNIATSSNANMGTASYQVYDKAGNAIVGMTQSGISADSNGQYKITAVSSSLGESLEHYMVKIDITVDGAIRSGYTPVIQKAPDYNIEGVMSIDSSSDLQGSFWITENEKIKTSGLGTASYTIYDAAGNAVVGMTESGISADGNGLFKITPVASALNQELSLYSVKVTINADGINRSDFLPLQGKVPSYECKAVFSINASNQLEATLWGTADGIIRSGASLGTASYTIYDVDGVAVVGLTESGITADGNGRFQITPVSAILLTDLTHFTATINIEIDGVVRQSIKGFTLLGT